MLEGWKKLLGGRAAEPAMGDSERPTASELENFHWDSDNMEEVELQNEDFEEVRCDGV